MTRLDQLAQPLRRNGEHIRAIVERERKLAMDLENLSRISFSQSPTASDKRMSRSMSQLAGSKQRYGSQGRTKSAIRSGDTSPMRKSDTSMSKSMSQLHTIPRLRTNRSEKLRQQIKDHLSRSVHSSSTTTGTAGETATSFLSLSLSLSLLLLDLLLILVPTYLSHCLSRSYCYTQGVTDDLQCFQAFGHPVVILYVAKTNRPAVIFGVLKTLNKQQNN
jgi:hypothetical protein